MKLQKPDAPESERIENEAPELEIGQWFWVKSYKHVRDKKTDEWEYVPDGRWLGCITHVGSNYVQLTSTARGTQRILYSEFDEECTPEPDADRVIARNIELHQVNVNQLMGKIKQLTAKLGIAPRAELAEQGEEGTEALVVAHGTKNIQAHKKALIKAKEKTLPELFEKIKSEHEELAKWMKATLIPMKAEAKKLKKSTNVIEDRIFTVELYAGLIEKLVKIKEGKPASNETKLHLYQRRHYMDEEILAHYKAGGMDYRSIKAFDKWMARKSNFHRLLPSPRCVVAFRVRRYDKEREGRSYSDFLRIIAEREEDRKTYLYIRNGEQLYRLSTGIDFGEQFFPDKDRSTILGNHRLYIKMFGSRIDKIITENEHLGYLEDLAVKEAKYKEEVKAWKKLSKAQKDKNWHKDPDRGFSNDFSDDFEECNPDSVYYDDAMMKIAREAMDHNRVAVVLQGLLDRSPAFHPHPPWQLWTAEGFSSGIELVYDQTRVLTPGDAPDFQAYREKLNNQIVRGSMTLGQQDYWERLEAVKENDRRARSWRHSSRDDVTHWAPYGNPGPGDITEVKKLGRKGQCTFEWTRDRIGDKWVSNPEDPGWMKRDEARLVARVTVPREKLFNVSAYKPGDFKIFFRDPRTRANYLKWAPFLLAAEDFHAKKQKKRNSKKTRR